MFRGFLIKAMVTVAACCLTLAANAIAASPKTVHVAPGPLVPALESLCKQMTLELIYQPKQLESIKTRGVSGTYTPQDALRILLEGTPLELRVDASGAMAVVPRATLRPRSAPHDSPQSNGTKGGAGDNSHRPFRLAAAPLHNSDGESSSNKDATVSGELAEVVVTAEKRETRLIDTPMSISVVDSTDIARKAMVGEDDYLSKVPGVGYSDEGPAFSQIVIRGLAIAPETDGWTSGPIVGVYFGEVPISGFGVAGSSSDLKLVDMDRVEVLKGPQGTLYGAGAMGGVIRNIPKAPDLLTSSADVMVGYSNTARYGSDNDEVTGVINIPVLEDTLAIRAVGYRYYDSPYYDNVASTVPFYTNLAQKYGAVPGEGKVGADTFTGGRIAALWRPSPRFDLAAGYVRQSLDENGWGETDTSLGNGYNVARLDVQQDIGQMPASNLGPEYMSDDVEIEYGVANYRFDGITATASLSHVTESTDFARDDSSYFLYPIGQHLLFGGHSDNAELRFASNWSGPFNAVAGYFHQTQTQYFRQTNSWAGSATYPYTTDPVTSGFYSSYYDASRSPRQDALYGEGGYEILKGLTLKGGLRLYMEQKELDTQLAENGATVPPPTRGEFKHNGVSGKAGIDYKPSRDTLLYALWSQGFRLGDEVISDPAEVAAQLGASGCGTPVNGYYAGLPGVSTGDREIKSDTVNNYELGAKGQFDDRFQVQASAYQIDWSNIPLNILYCGNTLLLNAGNARIRGGELSFSYKFPFGLNFGLNGGYTNGKLTSLISSIGTYGAVGDRLPGSPTWSSNADVEYDFKLGDRDAFVGINANYVGKYFETLNETGPEVDGFVNWSADAGVNVGRARFTVYGKNLTNSQKLTAVTSLFAQQTVNAYYGTRLQPRTVGIRLGYAF